MRTTIDIDDDVLQAAKELGQRRRETTGKVISDLARQALTSNSGSEGRVAESEEFYGFKPLPKAPGKIVTNALIDPAAIDRTRVHGARQVTDAYLLALAVRHGGRFVTFDRAVPLSAVSGATPENLIVL